MLNNIIKEFEKLKQVEAIVLSGSLTSAINDSLSDTDIYIYYNEEITKAEREEIIKEFTSCYTISTGFFEEGDEALIEGKNYDFMYRSIKFITDEINNTWINNYSRLGYTTCFLYNFKNSKILFDKNNTYKNAIEVLFGKYPTKLKKNIISKNLAIIDGPTLFPYKKQLELAIEREDIVSINHRISAIIASYFDVLFAFNEVLHPGEKKLVKYAKLLCTKIPENMEADIIKLLKGDQILINLENLISNLKKLVL